MVKFGGVSNKGKVVLSAFTNNYKVERLLAAMSHPY